MPFLPFDQILSLRKELKGSGAEIFTWGCHGYTDRIKQWSASCNTEVGALIRVTSADEAAKVVCFAKLHSIPLVVKGGGCSTTGASTTHGGIVLDLFNLRKVQVDAASRVVIAEGGVLWEDIDVAAAQHGLAVVGSTLNQIGAAGATLGGGYGWLTGQYGLAIDNLLWSRMILADGSFVTVSKTQNPDLFWAIRGAGQSFGVSIELAFQAHKQAHPVFAGTLIFSADCLPEIIGFANQFETLTDGKQGLWFGFIMLPALNQCSILVALFYDGTQAAADRFFSPLISLQPTFNSTQMLPYDSVNGMLSGIDKAFCRESLENYDTPSPNKTSVEPSKSLDGSNFTLPLDIDFVESIYEEFNRALQQWPQARESRILFEILPNTQVNKIANEDTAFASRGPYYNVSSLFKWHEANSDNMIHRFQRTLMERIGNQAGISRRHHYCTTEHGTGLYANYAGHGRPVEAIFGNNLQRLRELKSKYDPQNMFRHWHNIQEPLERQGVT